jgi:hypothetical protein
MMPSYADPEPLDHLHTIDTLQSKSVGSEAIF